jgi:hypothetical protein
VLHVVALCVAIHFIIHHPSALQRCGLWGVVFLPTATVCMCLASAGLFAKALAAQPALLGLLTVHVVHMCTQRVADLHHLLSHQCSVLLAGEGIGVWG